jgi:hypothetical protein
MVNVCMLSPCPQNVQLYYCVEMGEKQLCRISWWLLCNTAVRILNMAFFREHHKWKYWRETNSNLLKISKQIQQVWLWEDRKGKDVHPDRNVEK